MAKQTIKNQPIYETLLIGVLLAAVGGYMDAYTYMIRGEVFASLQSGNVILLGINLAAGRFTATVHYLVPILFFALGAGFAYLIEHYFDKREVFIWQQLSVLIELLGILLIGLLAPWLPNLLVTSGLSLFAAFQVQTFRKLNGHPFSTTMTTGNIKSVGAALLGWLFVPKTRPTNRLLLIDSLLIVFGFAAGAFSAAILLPFWQGSTIIGAAIILMFVFGLTQLDFRAHPSKY
ncbi:YoaK family protein [Agrilactobacillus fermenti]|uniref:YoaK family protein n=1 Tax=Agrilactobacillus fermenti TaxID=2586909 RepID=UPI001E57D597|nr:YoaK family protein [Agrilactobacillus fermenti]MCD2257284.1 DUF1275 domain-containing protein [Agrilactobacillus fermenti]